MRFHARGLWAIPGARFAYKMASGDSPELPGGKISKNKLCAKPCYLSFKTGPIEKYWEIVEITIHENTKINPKHENKTPSHPVVGHFANGHFANGQFAIGLFANKVGRFARGLFAIGQFAIGLFARGQFANGQFAIGLFANPVRYETFRNKTIRKFLENKFYFLFRFICEVLAPPPIQGDFLRLLLRFPSRTHIFQGTNTYDPPLHSHCIAQCESSRIISKMWWVCR